MIFLYNIKVTHEVHCLTLIHSWRANIRQVVCFDFVELSILPLPYLPPPPPFTSFLPSLPPCPPSLTLPTSAVWFSQSLWSSIQPRPLCMSAHSSPALPSTARPTLLLCFHPPCAFVFQIVGLSKLMNSFIFSISNAHRNYYISKWANTAVWPHLSLLRAVGAPLYNLGNAFEGSTV